MKEKVFESFLVFNFVKIEWVNPFLANFPILYPHPTPKAREI